MSELRALRSAVPTSYRHSDPASAPERCEQPGMEEPQSSAVYNLNKECGSSCNRCTHNLLSSSFVTFFYFVFLPLPPSTSPRGYFQNRSLVTAVNGTNAAALSFMAKLKEEKWEENGARPVPPGAAAERGETGSEGKERQNHGKVPGRTEELFPSLSPY